MIISSFIRDAFQEYEGYLSFVLFSFGCNLRCKRCYNLHEILHKKIGKAIPILEENLTPLHEAVVFLGGEPTIWGDKLVNTAEYVKTRKLKSKLYTNGLLPSVVSVLLDEDLIDSFSVDFKVIDSTEILGINLELNEYLDKVNKTIEMILSKNKDLEIRTVRWPGVNIEKIEEFVKKNYPGVRHIITNDFFDNLKQVI